MCALKTHINKILNINMRDNYLLWHYFLGKDGQLPPSSKLFQAKYNFRRGKCNVTKLFCCLYILCDENDDKH